MKDDEKTLLRAIANKPPGVNVRDVIPTTGINYKRAWYVLLKWCDKGWYNFGVNVDLGWLTPEGIEVAKSLSSRTAAGDDDEELELQSGQDVSRRQWRMV